MTGAIPTVRTHAFSTPWSEGVQTFPVYRPWLGRHDRDNIFFARWAYLAEHFGHCECSSRHESSLVSLRHRPLTSSSPGVGGSI